LRFLFGIMHPRRLGFFLKSLAALDYVDILLAENMEILTAQNAIREYFLTHDYDYLLFTSDDVEIPYLAPFKIMNDVELLGHDIITGWSICRPGRPEANINTSPPENIEEKKGKLVWIHEYRCLSAEDIFKKIKQGTYIIPVWFVGWSITAISRRVVEKWKPRGRYFQVDHFEPVTLEDGRSGFWASSDLWFSYQMWKEGFKKYADLTVYVPHHPQKENVLLVGKEKPNLRFIPGKKKPC